MFASLPLSLATGSHQRGGMGWGWGTTLRRTSRALGLDAGREGTGRGSFLGFVQGVSVGGGGLKQCNGDWKGGGWECLMQQ